MRLRIADCGLRIGVPALFLLACSGGNGQKFVVDAGDLAPEAEVVDVAPELDVTADLGPAEVEPETRPVDAGEDLVPEVCVPDCEGRECGPDGCGGSCGECGPESECDNLGQCACLHAECDPACCAQDEICLAGGGCCLPSCAGMECGDDGCGGSCGQCEEPSFACSEGACECATVPCGETCCLPEEQCGVAGTCCVPEACGDKQCGTEAGCGFSCGECAAGYKCDDQFQCVCAFDGCGQDCCGEGMICTPTGCCLPQCAGKQCGPDGCGAACGECADNELCSNSLCTCKLPLCNGTCCQVGEVCTPNGCCLPDCTGKECGDDGCGGSCGTCAGPSTCQAGKCVCNYKQCGAVCCVTAVDVCFNGTCCTPVCVGKECGDDLCGGSCGACDPGCECGGGMCIGSCGVCQPDCAGKQCGLDGCNGTCGTCAVGTHCDSVTFKCVGGACSLPTKFPGTAAKMNYLKAGVDGSEGEALDIDNNPNTCAPKNMCSGGRDNQFGALLKSMAPALGGKELLLEAVQSGAIILLFEFVDPKFDGTPFVTNLYRGLNVLPKEQCDFQTQTCDYQVLKESFDLGTCLSKTMLDNTQISGGILTAGGPKYKFEFPFVIGMVGTTPFMVPATHTKVVANVVFDNQGKVTYGEGLIGCAVSKQAMIDVVKSIPDGQLPLSKDMILMLLDMVITPDIDADGDGKKESVSAGMKFQSIPAKITGLAP